MALIPERTEIKLRDKKISQAKKAILPDPVAQPHWKKRRLSPAATREETCHAKPATFGQAT